METTSLPAVKVLDQDELGYRKIKALIREKLGLPADASVTLSSVTWDSSPETVGVYEYHRKVTVDYEL